MIPRVAHFVFGLEEQHDPFHFLHYVSMESCRRLLEPEAIYFHHKHLPWGPWWQRIRPHLTLVEVDHVEEVFGADYLPGLVPPQYRYAHHADFIRLDALIEHGGIYADIDTIFLQPFPDELFDAPFVIGREPPVRDERTGEMRPSLCNALLMGEPGSRFARTWRAQMAAALNGTWSNHSGFLAERLSTLSPAEVHVAPEVAFCPFPPSHEGLSQLLERQAPPATDALSAHLWAHLWWERERVDFSPVHAGWFTPALVRRASATVAEMARPYLPAPAATVPEPPSAASGPASRSSSRWGYLSLDEDSGYGIAAQRCIAALDESGREVEWTPFVKEPTAGYGYRPTPGLPGSSAAGARPAPTVLVAHLVAEYFPSIRQAAPDSFLVGHTVWDTSRIPAHWIPCLDLADVLIVPSRFAAHAIRDSPVSTPVEIVPHVAPPVSSASPAEWGDIPEDVFVFYTIGDWTERKAIVKTVEAYLRAFTSRDRVLLVVKTSHRDLRGQMVARNAAGPGTSAWSVAQLVARYPDAPAVKLITRRLPDAAIAALHRRGNCFVSLCRSEGFGLGPFDAVAHGNPVVITGFGGQLDYLSGSPYLVGFDLVPVVDPVGAPSYSPDQHWAEPDVEHGAELLRRVAQGRDEAAAVGAALAAKLPGRYGPPAIAAAFCAAVDRHFRGHAQPAAHAATNRSA